MQTAAISIPVDPKRSPRPNATLNVVAVSRAQPATHAIHSQPTLTAIVRKPSPDPLVLSPELGIHGHKSAVHDAQVYAFFAKHYDYWTSHVGVERSAWDWALWGENLTVDGGEHLDERNTLLGDQWVFKSADSEEDGVILEVVGCRNPC